MWKQCFVLSEFNFHILNSISDNNEVQRSPKFRVLKAREIVVINGMAPALHTPNNCNCRKPSIDPIKIWFAYEYSYFYFYIVQNTMNVIVWVESKRTHYSGSFCRIIKTKYQFTTNYHIYYDLCDIRSENCKCKEGLLKCGVKVGA